MSSVFNMQTAYLPLSQALQLNPKLSNLEIAQLLQLVHPDVHMFSVSGRPTALYTVSSSNEVSYFDDRVVKDNLITYLNLPSKKADDAVLSFKNVLSLNMLKLEDVVPVAFSDHTHLLTWKRLTFTEESTALISPDDIPEYIELVSRINEQERDYLTLWLGSLLHYQSDRAQYIHLKGEGGDGKSILLSALNSFFSKSYISTKSSRIFDSFFGSELEGKRLLCFRDENNTSFTQSGSFKELTGDPTLTINEKYKPVRTIQLTCKVIITSNFDVEINDSNADSRRLISLTINSPSKEQVASNPHWGDNLIGSIEKIMCYCYNKYMQLPAHEKRVLPFPQANITKAQERAVEHVLDVFYEHFEVTGESSDIVSKSIISTVVGVYRDPKRTAQLYSFLKKNPHIGEKKVQGQRFLTGIKQRSSILNGGW